MEENPEPGDFLCRSYLPDRGNEIASTWAYTATDPDGGALTYSLEGRDADKFDIDPANGNVRTKTGVTYDYETQGSCRYAYRTYPKCFEMTLKATDPSGLSDSEDIIVRLDPGFEIRGLNAGWTTVRRQAVPWIDVNWDRPWHGGHTTRLKEFEIEFYDVSFPSRDASVGNRFMHRVWEISKNSSTRRITNDGAAIIDPIARAFRKPGAGRLTPSVEVGLRHDGGDAETGTGIELGGALRYEGTGVSIEGAVRTLIAHEESGYEEWGASGAIRVDPGASSRGLSLTLRPSWGNASSGMDRLWSPGDAHGLARDNEFEAESRLEGEVRYGLTLRQAPGVVTPYAGMTLGDAGERAWRTGARWQVGADAALGFEASSAGEAGAGVALRARLRF